MSKFRFEGLLKIREAEMHEKQAAFLKVQTLVKEVQQKIEICKQDLYQNQQEIRKRRSNVSSFSTDELLHSRRFHAQLNQNLQFLQQDLEQLLEEEMLKREEFQEAIKEVKTLQILKEKLETRLTEEEKRRTDKEMDALAIQQEMLERLKKAGESIVENDD